MNTVSARKASKFKEPQIVHQPSTLATAVRGALAATSLALLSSTSAFALPCSTSNVSACSSNQSNSSPLTSQDLARVAADRAPSAVTQASLTSDNAAIDRAATQHKRIINTGDITKSTADDVIGLEAVSDNGDVNVVNAANIHLTTDNNSLADGIFAAGGRTSILNTGSISASGYNWVAGIENQSSDAARIRNEGDISISPSSSTGAGYIFGRSYGIFSSNSGDGGTFIRNGGSITGRAGAYSVGIFAYDGGADELRIINAGDIVVLTKSDQPETPINETEAGVNTGVWASKNAAGSKITFENSGLIDIRGTYRATNGAVLAAHGFGSSASAVNSGTIRVTSEKPTPNGQIPASTGLHVAADGDVAVNNTASGHITTIGNAGSHAIRAASDNGMVRINNDGLLDSQVGISTIADNGESSIRNSGIINADVGVTGFSANERIFISNSGTIRARAGALAVATHGSATFINTGTIESPASQRFAGFRSAATIIGENSAVAINSGLIDQTLINIGFIGSTAMETSSGFGESVVRNGVNGVIKQTSLALPLDGALGSKSVAHLSTALIASTVDGSASASNAGTLEIRGLSKGNGNLVLTGLSSTAQGTGRAITFNSNILKIAADDLATSPNTLPQIGGQKPQKSATGLFSLSKTGDALALNTGRLSIETKGTLDVATQPEIVGVLGRSDTGNVVLENAGSVDIETSTSGAILDDQHGGTAIDGGSTSGDVSVLNSGSIAVNGIASTGALAASGGGAVAMKNTGMLNISSSHGNATGLGGNINGGTLSIANAGIINVTAASAGVRSAGILASATDGEVVTLNSGLINATAAGGNAYGILGTGNGNAKLVNTGKIVAGTAIQAGDGITTISNHGILVGAVGGGAGNDTINNHQGASWDMSGRVSSFGAGNDNLRNMGFLLLKDSRFDFGEGSNGFSNAGTIKLAGSNLIDMGATGSARFTNAGLLDFTNGKAGDSLAITGHFGGVGNINLDVDLTAGIGDWLSVSGVTATGTQQKLNIALLDGLPTSDALNQPLKLVQVAGNSNPNAFVPGQVLGISPADFLKLDMSVAVEKVAGTKGGNYLLSITPKVAGLNASGTLVSAAAMGVDSMLSSTSGNWRDRAAMIHSSSALPGLKGITPWVRGFRDTGGMSSSNMVGNFGQAHSSNLNQDNSGSEIGFNLDAGNGFNLGATVAKSEAKQYLAKGYGTDTLHGSSVGMYATWNSQGGAYLDASVRGMQFDAYLDTVAGRQQGQGDAHMFNLESGRTWTLRNGLNVEPQAQFTSTKVSGMNVRGDKAVMQTETSNWQRGRVGVSLWKSYRGVSGWNVTPYGQINALHTLEGTLDYNINRDFHGQLNSEGTMAMFKFGVNAAKGRFKLGSALNWQSGNQLDSGLGMQTQLSYAW